MRLRSLGLAAALIGAFLHQYAPASVSSAQSSPPVVSVIVDGQGNGHGRGLSQWGSYGWSVNHGSTWQQILDYYYGGTTWGGRGNESIGVRLLAMDGSPVTAVISTSGQAVWNGVAYGSVHAWEVAPNVYDIYVSATADCPGSTAGVWHNIARVAGPVTFTTPVDQTAGAPGDALGLCQPNGSVIHYRGAIRAVNDGAGDNHTVNDVLVENYLRGVLPREVPASWGFSGGGAGMNALRAMAVAARSFGLSQNRYPSFGARTCDSSACQVYGGAAARSSAPAAATTREHPNTDRAAAETAGVVRVWPDGRIVSTEYSATHGPYSAGGSFPAVDDSVSGVPQNPLFTWTRVVDAAAIEGRYGLGDLTAAYTERDPSSPYHGVWGNRVVLQGTARTVILSNLEFRNAFGFPSHGFAIRQTPWYSVGGPYGSDPTAVSTPGAEFLFAVDAARQPWLHQRFGGQWSGSIAMGGLLTSPVVPAVPDPQRSDVEVFGVGVDGAVWYSNLTSGWHSLGGLVISAPAAAQLRNRTFVFAVGWDRGLYYQELSGGVPLGWQALGGQIFSDPTVIVDGGLLHVVGVGSDGALWTQQLSGSSWSGWQTLGGLVTSAPTAISRPSGHVFAIGVDRAVWYRQVSGGQWGGWTTFGGISTSEVALTQSRDGMMAFVVGVDGAMYHRRLTGGGWTWWSSLGGVITSHPAAGPTEVVGLGSDRRLWVKGYLTS